MEDSHVEDPSNDLEGRAGSLLMSQSDDLKRAVKNNDRTGAFELLQAGADPFRTFVGIGGLDQSTAFYEASRRHDLELLLHMAAEPGTTWTKRFLLCRDKEVEVPTQGRACISSMSGKKSFFSVHHRATMEGLEVMMMYGYKLKEGDLMGVCFNVAKHPECLRLVKFCLAAGLFDKDDNVGSIELERGLGFAIGGNDSCCKGFHASSIALARILLSAGANPNGDCFKSLEFWHALFQSIKNRDEEMTRLLLEYGADATASADDSRWTILLNNNGQVVDIEQISIVSLATEANMLELLDPPTTLADVNKKEFVKALRRELARPLKMLVANQSAIVIVAMMRSTGQVPPLGLITQSILEFCPFGFDFWKL
eukprot:scaffold75836_cov51-Attheya_sp.AAC.1